MAKGKLLLKTNLMIYECVADWKRTSLFYGQSWACFRDSIGKSVLQRAMSSKRHLFSSSWEGNKCQIFGIWSDTKCQDWRSQLMVVFSTTGQNANARQDHSVRKWSDMRPQFCEHINSLACTTNTNPLSWQRYDWAPSAVKDSARLSAFHCMSVADFTFFSLFLQKWGYITWIFKMVLVLLKNHLLKYGS